MRRNLTTAVFIVVLYAIVGLSEPRFLTPSSINSILLWMPIITIMALGQLLVVISGGIDISIGSILGCSGIAVGLFLKDHPQLPVPLALLLGVLVGLVLGAFNAAIITWGKIAPLLVTIGTLAGIRGICFLISKGQQVDSNMIPDGLTALARTGVTIGEVTISWLLVISLASAALFGFAMHRTIGAKNLLAFGSNPTAAHLRGISSNAITFWIYSLSGAVAGLAGVMYAARFGFVNPSSAGQSIELTVIAAVAIGGAKLTGGFGNVTGTLLGCFLLSSINVALTVMGIDANWQLLAYGSVIFIAVLVDGLSRRRATS
ncbi:MAG: ABC transporter permease [Fimbriimonadaceae bacterium]